MSQGTLTIYNASAGSGKTYTLTGIYLSSLFRSAHNYRKILAVTFTNKATAEMKSRILDNLYKLSSGDKCEYLGDLLLQTGKTEDWIRKEAGKILNLILHDFSRFSVSTIDSFFQTILRAFSREAGLHSGYNIELDNEIWISAAVDETISSASGDKQLRDWLISYAISNIDNEKSWNLKSGIMHLSRELFSEKFRLLSEKEMDKLADKKFLSEYAGKMRQIEFSFINYMKDAGRKAEELLRRFNLNDDMFYRKSQGIPRYIRLLACGEIVEPNCYVREIMDDPPRWATGRIDPSLKEAVNAGLGDLLQDSIAYYDRNIVACRTSKVITANIYALGILTDILKNIHILTSSENTFLLSDAGEFLRLIIEADQCPFIYEKAGNTFENFMIDEFQDTSMVQWKNFYPLITNSMAQGFDNLVVGDIKQSIYRWRNSDWKILRSMLADTQRDARIKTNPLTVNWRSCSNIIRFNNSLFSILPSIIDEKIGNDSLTDRFDSLYEEAIQQDPGRKEGGYVKIEFVESSDEKDWEELVLEKIPLIIESVQDNGYSAADIGIIVRDRRQGAKVLKCMTDYANTCTNEKKAKYSYNVFSNDSLLLSGSPVINFIVSVLKYLNDPSDMISKASFLNLYQIATGEDDIKREIPENYEDFLLSLSQKPLYESIEQIILFFGLGKLSWNTAWLTTFQDCLLGYVNNGNPDLKTFLEWWAETGCRKSVILPGNQDAVRVLTIHKSKGLEFSAVILPFISWPLDHLPLRQPLLWVKPEIAPFNELGIVPVKCSKELTGTIFSANYFDEKYSIYLDNLNLLYVATTRAKDVLYGFAPAEPGKGSIAAALRESFDADTDGFLKKGFGNNIFESGKLPSCPMKGQKQEHSIINEYPVTYASKSLRLKLHGENYFSEGDAEIRKRINYGKIMHEVFEGIETASDVDGAVRKLVLEGKLPFDEALIIEERIKSLLSDPFVAPWFAADNKVMKEAAILLTSGNIRRPDRVIFKDGKTTVIDFKFGNENEDYRQQLNLYRSIITDMGYGEVEAYIWYVDRNKIVRV